MSGHSKWATIKRKKGAADAKRGQTFTKLANAIAIAAREGDSPDTNFKLRLAIDKARASNMPVANIERSIARGSGKLKGEQISEVTYEGYGPAGVAIIVQCATDNKNRTYADVRTAFSKNGGNLAEPGAVAFQFEQRGMIQIESGDREAAALAAIDAGAAEVEEEQNVLTIYCEPKQLSAVKSQLEASGYLVANSEISMVPKSTVAVTDSDQARKVINLMDALEELDDVTATFSNFDIAEDILAKN